MKFNFHRFITNSNFILISWKVCKTKKPRGFALHWSCNPSPPSPPPTLPASQGHWKWYKVIEANGAHMYGRYEKNMVEKLAFNVQCYSFCHARQLAEHDWLCRPICYSYGSTNLWFSTPTNDNSTPNSTQPDWEPCELIGIEVFAFSHLFDIESKSRSLTLVSKCRTL